MHQLDGPVLDRQQISDITGGDTELILQLYDAFQEETAGHSAELEQALAAGNAEDAARAAHSIKGAAGNLGYAEIYRMATDVVERARVGDLGGCRATAAVLPEAMRRLEAAVGELCGDGGG